MRILKNDHQRENALIFYHILLTYPLRKYIEINLEILYVNIGTLRFGKKGGLQAFHSV